ncbi:uncharacterized protein LOC117305237 isoform X2 [Asterias rubens]|uniref:Calcitonin-type n=1 Tax=Asterias rubens TaxID=7604 RepID=A0A0U2JER4_ASTRU|nr:uncharacterized protein LOC117305237 isoform X2 [Asterias rubens]ALJ99957.1 calcitonin-type precursor [Asterias rubens]
MKPTTVLTLAVFCTLYTIITAASISRDDDMFDVTGDDLRQLAKKVDTYARNNEIQSLLKRNGESRGCSGFGGCGVLTIGHNAAMRMLAESNSPFGASGPGKRRRSVDAVANQEA